jgi:hypothetical protein
MTMTTTSQAAEGADSKRQITTVAAECNEEPIQTNGGLN